MFISLPRPSTNHGMLEVLFQVMMLHLIQKDLMPVWLQY